jgi:hypothetical protein
MTYSLFLLPNKTLKTCLPVSHLYHVLLSLPLPPKAVTVAYQYWIVRTIQVFPEGYFYHHKEALLHVLAYVKDRVYRYQPSSGFAVNDILLHAD